MEYTCTLNENCPEYFNKLIPEKSKCIDNCKNDNIYKYEYNNTCYEKCPGDTIASFENEYLCLEDNIINDYKNISINESILENMKEYLLNDYNKTKSGNDIEIETKNLLITITNAFNQKNNIYKNKTTIDLGDCEKELIKYYNISENESLYILKMDFKEEGMKIPKIEYEVYYPLNDTHLFILNLTICKNIRIDISIPIDINDNDIDKYNPDSDYYNDVCSKTTSDSGTDISLTDRKIKFIDDNMTLCEEDCKLIHYNSTTKKAQCSCLVKISLLNIKDIKFDKDKLRDNFIDINNIANIKLMKCFKKVFLIHNLIKNYGFYIFSFIYILYVICLFLFSCKYYYQLINNIDNAIEAKIKKPVKKAIKNMETRNNNFTKQKKVAKKSKTFRKPIIIKKDGNPPRKRKSKTINVNSGSKNNFIRELNSLPYEKALIYDKRTYVQYYISLLKIKHSFIFSFYCNDKDYNSQIIKIFLFFFFFAVHFTINALFFNDDTMHTIYLEEGEFNFIYQIPIIIYSSLISGVIKTIIKYLALTESLVLEIKSQKKIKNFETEKNNIHEKIKYKFVLFFIISFLLLLFFAYYISCFCGVYINTQIHLIKDSIISFALSLLYPFGLFLIPGIFRISSLNSKDKKPECLYKFSSLIENLIT